MESDQQIDDQQQIDIETLIHTSILCGCVYGIPDDVYIDKRKDGTKYIIVEGSDSLFNWVDNLSFLFKRKDMHRGFYRYAKYCIEKYDLLRELNDPTATRIVFAGHSLGAARVAIVMTELGRELTDDIARDIILFGCPQVGGRKFKKRFQESILKHNDKERKHRCLSLRNGKDVVCGQPFGIFGYTKCDQLIQIDPCCSSQADGDEKVDNERTTMTTNSSQKKTNGIQDHMIGEYSKTLETYQTNNQTLPSKIIANATDQCGTTRRGLGYKLVKATVRVPFVLGLVKGLIKCSSSLKKNKI